MQIDFWMLSGLIFHLHSCNVTLVIWQSPGVRERRRRRRIFVPKRTECSQHASLLLPGSSDLFSTFTSSLNLRAFRWLSSLSFISSLAQEKKKVWQREKKAPQRTEDRAREQTAAMVVLFCTLLMRSAVRGKNAFSPLAGSVDSRYKMHLEVMLYSLVIHLYFRKPNRL